MKRFLSAFIIGVILLSSTSAYAIDFWGSSTVVDVLFDETLASPEQKTDIILDLLAELEIMSVADNEDVRSLCDMDKYLHVLTAIAGLDQNKSNKEELFAAGLIRSNLQAQPTMGDFLYSAIQLTGYETEAERHGGYPMGYYMQAQNVGLMRNLMFEQEKRMTLGELAQFTYNTLAVVSQEVSRYYNGSYIYEIPEEKTLLERRFSVVMKKGVLTASYPTSLYHKANISTERIEINGESFLSSKRYSELLGQSVIAFVRQEDTDVGTLLTAAADNKNSITTLHPEDIAAVKEGYITAYLDGKESGIHCSSETIIVYNMATAGNYSTALFNKYIGDESQITFVDNDDDGETDVIFVEEYENFIAKYTVGNGDTISFKYDQMYRGQSHLALNTDNMDFDIYIDGQAAKASEITANSAISILSGNNLTGKSYIKIEVSTRKVNGEITEISEDNGTVLAIDNKKYKLAKSYENALQTSPIGMVKPSVGLFVECALSVNGDIVDIVITSGDKFGYMLSYDRTEGLDPKGKIRLMDANAKIDNYELADQVLFYNEVNLYGKNLKEEQVLEQLDKISSHKMLIKYQINSNSEITKLILPVDCTGEPRPGTLDYPLTLDYAIPSSATVHFYLGMVANTYRLRDTCPLFIIPPVGMEDDESFYDVIVPRKYDTDLSYTYMKGLQLYAVNDTYRAQAGVAYSKGSKSISASGSFGMIDRVTTKLNDQGEECISIYLYLDGKEQKFYINDNDDVVIDDEWYSVKAEKLKFGDILQPNILNGKLLGYRVVFRLSEPGTHRLQQLKDSNKDTTTDTYVFDNHGLYYCSMVKMDEEMMLVDFGSGTTVPIMLADYGNYLNVYLVDQAKEKITVTAQSEIRIGDEMVLRRRWHDVWDVFILR